MYTLDAQRENATVARKQSSNDPRLNLCAVKKGKKTSAFFAYW